MNEWIIFCILGLSISNQTKCDSVVVDIATKTFSRSNVLFCHYVLFNYLYVAFYVQLVQLNENLSGSSFQFLLQFQLPKQTLPPAMIAVVNIIVSFNAAVDLPFGHAVVKRGQLTRKNTIKRTQDPVTDRITSCKCVRRVQHASALHYINMADGNCRLMSRTDKL